MRLRLTWLLILVAAFAYVESSVVVYLRVIYFPDGFAFPFKAVPDRLSLIEVGREACTIFMLLGAGILMGSTRWQRFLWFCIAFGVWDILYYFWLYVFEGWPPSLMTLDVLFLIPVAWISPVLAPVLISISMIAACAWLLRLDARGVTISFSWAHWALAVTGGLVCIVSFTLDCMSILEGRMPDPFNWPLFLAGLAMAWLAAILGIRRLARGLPCDLTSGGGLFAREQ